MKLNKSLLAIIICFLFTQTNKTLSQAIKTLVVKNSFIGTWKNIKNNEGEMLSEILIIELLENGNFLIKEKDKGFMRNSFFNSIKYENGVINGNYNFSADNDHTYKFKIRMTDNNTISYKEERGAEIFKRIIETDNFTGKWNGNRITFIITKENDKYRVIVTNEGIKGAPTDNLICTFRNGKIIYSGNEKDFYKYQIPTIELLPNGNLMYRDGAADIELLKTE